ncbi:variable surface protein [Plasmodium gonderi]|uniref:Variable surface protein n=1 Tax=Plasmodium gonderi TaxID=77519 RepID=A0A1Y1JD28_PLAGO|nr:variable surface protein [Plasmodium gonderi]GAW80431.1 variable surface protein [Plasmodium gonderi]
MDDQQIHEIHIYTEPLNAHLFYYLLDDGSSFDNNCDKCKASNDPKSIKICCVFYSMLNEWDAILDDLKLDKEKCCNYLIYWLYGKLSENKFSAITIHDLYDTFKKLFTKKCSKGAENDLYKIFVKSYDMSVLKNKKHLYDFIEHFSSIKELLDKVENGEKKKRVCEYLKYIISLYQKVEMQNGRKEYCPELIIFEEKFKDKGELDLINSKCNTTLNLIINEKNTTFCAEQDHETTSVRGHKIETTFRKKKFTDNTLKDVPFYNLYHEYNKNENTEKYKEYCENIYNLYGSNNEVCNLCEKLSRNLIYVSNLENEEKHNIGCSYFIHWVYEQVLSIENIKANYEKDNPVIIELYKVVNNINMREFTYKPCYVFFDYTLDEWKEWKILHDYFMNYDCTIGKKDEPIMDKCKIKCEDLFNINELYGKYINESCTYFSNKGYINERPEYFMCDEKYNPYNLYLHLNCNNENSDNNFKKVDLPEPIDYYSKYITEKSEKEYLLYKNFYKSRNTTILGDISEYDPFYPITLSAFVLLGMSLFFFIFYKFTPFRTWIHRKKRSNKKVYYNHNLKYKKEMLDQRSRSKQINSQRRRVNIAYQHSGDIFR